MELQKHIFFKKIAMLGAVALLTSSLFSQENALSEKSSAVGANAALASDSLEILVKNFIAARERKDEAAYRKMASPNMRVWYEEKKGEGFAWNPNNAWALWDEFFNGQKTYGEFRTDSNAVTVVVTETNDFFQLIERPPAPVQLTWWVAPNGLIEGYLVKSLSGDAVPDRLDEFEIWAKQEDPTELAYLMPHGKINPEGDRPQRWKKMLARWRQQADKISIPGAVSEEVSFLAKDSVRVFADLIYRGAKLDKTKPLLLLFHMVRSNGRSEYRNIAPRLVSLGYNLLIVDHRQGSGQEHGGENRTSKALPSIATGDYCSALSDIEAAWDYTVSQGFSGKIILWGSGLSAALVLRVAANHPNKPSGVLAFAPAQGNMVAVCEPTEDLLARLKLPVAAFRAEGEMSQPGRKEQAELFAKFKIPYHVVPGSRHGSSVLDARRNRGTPTDKAWDWVEAFLKSLH